MGGAQVVQALLGVLERGEARQRGTLLARVVAVVVDIAVLALFLGLGVFGVWRAWQTGEWSEFSDTSIVIFIPVFIFIVLGPVVSISTRLSTMRPERLRDGARALRELAASGDAQLAPAAPLQPAPLAAGLPGAFNPPSGAAVRIGPLKRVTTIQPNRIVPLVTLPLAGIVILLIVAFPLFDSFGSSSNGLSPFFTLFPALFPAVFLFVLVPVVALGVMARKGRTFAATVDGQGITWARDGQKRPPVHIAWGQARSLFRVVASPGDLTNRTTYVLDTPDASLVWTTTPSASDEEFAASEQLLRTITARTGQPLRDLSVFATELGQAGGNAARVWSGRVAAGGTTGRPDWAAPAPYAGKPTRRRHWGTWAAVVGLVLVFGSLYGGSVWLQQYQPQYFASLPARVHAERPAFSDSMTLGNGNWPQFTPTTDQVYGARYAHGVYQLYGSQAGSFDNVLEPYAYGDAAVEVTAMQTGRVEKDGRDGAGLALRSDRDSGDFLTFQVTYAGGWEVWHYHYVDDNPDDNWNELANGTSDAINHGPGAANRLLVIMRGSELVLYVNDQYVGRYYDRYDGPIPASGMMGLYLNDTALVGTFTDFAVYPVRPPNSFDYV